MKSVTSRGLIEIATELKNIAGSRPVTQSLIAELIQSIITNPPPLDQRLRAEIEGDRLVISIGLRTLGFAAEHCDDNPNYEVLDCKELAKDVIRELDSEEENGSTPMSDLLDAMITKAYENGSLAFGPNKVAPR